MAGCCQVEEDQGRMWCHVIDYFPLRLYYHLPHYYYPSLPHLPHFSPAFSLLTPQSLFSFSDSFLSSLFWAPGVVPRIHSFINSTAGSDKRLQVLFENRRDLSRGEPMLDPQLEEEPAMDCDLPLLGLETPGHSKPLSLFTPPI